MKDWLLPSAILTGVVLAVGAALGSLDLDLLVNWTFFSVQAWVLIAALAGIYAMTSKRRVLDAMPETLPIAPMLLLGGLATPAYNAIKTWLNQFGFWADPALARIDTALFGWLYIEPLSNAYTANFYFTGWTITLLLTLVVVPMRAPSLRRDALILGYFLLWCVFAPLVQWVLPAGGPVFYQRLGHGDLFADYPFADTTLRASAYLWDAYGEGISAFSTGISAMPSLHVASSVWIAMVWHKTRLAPVGYAFAGTIFVLSVALGWHYAIDGIVGGGLTYASYALAKRWLATRQKPVGTVLHERAPA